MFASFWQKLVLALLVSFATPCTSCLSNVQFSLLLSNLSWASCGRNFKCCSILKTHLIVIEWWKLLESAIYESDAQWGLECWSRFEIFIWYWYSISSGQIHDNITLFRSIIVFCGTDSTPGNTLGQSCIPSECCLSHNFISFVGETVPSNVIPIMYDNLLVCLCAISRN